MSVVYQITKEQLIKAKDYALEKSKTEDGFSWDNTILAGVKSNSNQFTVGDFGEKLAEIILNDFYNAKVSINKTSDLDLISTSGATYEVKTSFKAPSFYKNKNKKGIRKNAGFFCNQIRFETVSDQSKTKNWDNLVFVLCDGVEIQIWMAKRSQKLRESLSRNNDMAWRGTFKSLEEASEIWVKLAEGKI
jgi:hypothetical protein